MRRSLLLAGLLCAAGPSPAAPGDPAGAAPAARGAPVVVRHRTVVVLRAPFQGYSPEERARMAAARVAALVEGGKRGTASAADAPQGRAVQIGGKLAFVITPGDLDAAAEETLEGATAGALRTLAALLAEEEERGDVRALLVDAAYALVATVLYALLLAATGRATRWLRARLGASIDRLAGRIQGGGALLISRMLLQAVRVSLRLAGAALAVAATYAWLTFCLSRFPWTRAWGEALTGFVLEVLRTVALGVVGWVPGLVFVTAIFAATHYLNRGVGLFFDAVAAGQIRMPEAFVETAQPTRRLVSLALWLFALVMAYPYLPGSGTEAFKGISVFVGLLVSLGGTGVVGHATSGMVLMFSRALRPGDYVRVGEHEGVVLSLGTLSTKLRTPWLEEVNIPNSVLAGTTMTNYSRAARDRGVVLHTSVTIGYDTPWRQVHALLALAAGRTPGLRAEPAPYVLQMALADFYVEYQLNAVLERPEERIPVLAALHARIQDAFNEHGVQIMSPHYLGDPAQPKVVPPARWREPPAAEEP